MPDSESHGEVYIFTPIRKNRGSPWEEGANFSPSKTQKRRNYVWLKNKNSPLKSEAVFVMGKI